MAKLTLSDVWPVLVKANCVDCGRYLTYTTWQENGADAPSLWERPRCRPCQRQFELGNIRITVNGRVGARKRTPADPQ